MLTLEMSSVDFSTMMILVCCLEWSPMLANARQFFRIPCVLVLLSMASGCGSTTDEASICEETILLPNRSVDRV